MRVQDVRPEFIVIAGSWEDGYGRKGAKWGSERVVPIPTRAATELEIVIKENEYQEPADLVFTGSKRGVPLDKHMIEEWFYSALKAIGVDGDLAKVNAKTRQELRIEAARVSQVFPIPTIDIVNRQLSDVGIVRQVGGDRGGMEL